MQKSVTFINLDSSEALKAYAFEKLDRFDKFLQSAAKANVVLTVEKFRHIAEINISADGFTVNAREETSDMYSAIDMGLDKIDKQIKKNKDKFKKRRSLAAKHKTFPYEEISEELSADAEQDSAPKLMRIKNVQYKPMDVDEAVLQMRLIKDNFLVFADAETDEINVLYRLKDGNFGLIQPGA
ncbi:MAG: ribosome-associated translation inhibitor RaiA [Deltaproteobacteria bacterium]|nr:ribosome-associated translation inhibitor RaiA [Deltaproteobacteria bacterium]